MDRCSWPDCGSGGSNIDPRRGLSGGWKRSKSLEMDGDESQDGVRRANERRSIINSNDEEAGTAWQAGRAFHHGQPSL